MIKLRATNFQSIKDAEIDVDGFTLLVGETSAGKSAFLRSLVASTCNKFRSGFVRYGEKELGTSFEADGHTFTTSKSDNGGTTMVLDDTTFTKMGRDVPKEIADFLNIGNLEVSDSKFNLNVHPQFQKPLLLEFSQKKVMEILSTSKGLTDLKTAQSLLTSKRSEVKGSITATDRLREDTSRSLEQSVAKMSKVKEPFLSYQKDYECYKQLSTRSERLNALNALLEEADRYRHCIDVRSKSLETMTTCIESLDKQKTTKERLCSLKESLVKQSYHSDKIKRAESRISILEKCSEITDLIYDISMRGRKVTQLDCALVKRRSDLEKVDRLTIKQDALVRLSDIQSELTDKKTRLSRLKLLSANIESLDLKRKEVDRLDSIVNKGICPICGNLITNHNH